MCLPQYKYAAECTGTQFIRSLRIDAPFFSMKLDFLLAQEVTGVTVVLTKNEYFST